MERVSRQDVWVACRRLCPEYTELAESRGIALPTIMDSVAREAFMGEMEGEDVEILKQGLRQLSQHGVLA